MMSYNGQTITYDQIGNPLTYRDGMMMTWTGRQLTAITQNGQTASYKYDVDGLRLEKTANGVTTEYQYVNGQLLGEKRSNGVILRYTYDPFGALSSIQYKNTSGTTTNYIVRCTLSGDVDQIFNTSGNLVARYIYDTWGNTVSIADASGNAITSATHIANINPIRYRGYYWDKETGFYYLQSRYYDTETKRFVNADTVLGISAGATYNLYNYCSNNPVNMIDSSGMYPIEVGEDPNTIFRDFSGIIAHWAASQKTDTRGAQTPIKPNEPPPESSGYKPPKKNPNPQKVKNPNGPGRGWPSSDGGVWMPDNNQDGGPGWTVQYPDGSHNHRYPDGHIRTHTKISINWWAVAGVGIVIASSVGIAWVVVNDVSLVGALDDVALPVLIATMGKGVCMIFG